MSDLTPLLNALEPADTWLRLESAHWEVSDCSLVFAVDDGKNGPSLSRWAVTCQGVVENLIEDVNGGGLGLNTGDHEAIRQFTAPHARLLLRGPAEEPGTALAALWKTHRSVSNEWIAFDRYLVLDPEYRQFSENWTGDEPFDYSFFKGAELDLDEILKLGKGVLAEGPDFLLQAYAEALSRCGVACELEPWKPEPDDSDAGLPGEVLEMIHFGDSYFVAHGFSCKLLDEDKKETKI